MEVREGVGCEGQVDMGGNGGLDGVGLRLGVRGWGRVLSREAE